jgi:O-acetyl-ADP-ribose deacetylase (regulator of RNase III)
MIHIQRGDLFKADVNFILHQANCESLMGKGIAKTIAHLYPLAEKVDKQFPYTPQERLGKYSIATIQKNKLYIVNLYGQLFRGKANSAKEQNERYAFLKESLTSFLADLNRKQKKEKRTYKVGLPYKVASDMAGGSWERILEILLDVSEVQKIDLHIYKKDS